MTTAAVIDETQIQEWIASRLEPDTIRQMLQERGLDAESIRAYIRAFRKVKNAKRQTNGFICMAVGAFLGFVSCVLSLTNPIPALYNVILYGLTSVSILIIMLGLYFVFE